LERIVNFANFMNAPFFWLDTIVVVCAITAATFGLLTIGRAPGLRRAQFRFFGSTLFGIALLLGGTDSLLTIHDAPRSILIGTITHLTNHRGKQSSCDVAILDNEAALSMFSGAFSCDGLHTGDQIRLQWMNFNHRIASLDVLGGPDTGSFRRGGDPFASLIGIAGGLYLIYAARRSQRLNPTAVPSGPISQEPLQGDVDEASLLHLSDR
jgi:hypothetical protein